MGTIHTMMTKVMTVKCVQQTIKNMTKKQTNVIHTFVRNATGMGI